MQHIDDALREMADPAYRAFQCRLIPTVAPDRVLGVRVPELRRFARRIAGTSVAEDFLRTLPHASYDADNLHACLLSMMRDREALMAGLTEFLPYIDNWATCDMLRPRLLGQDVPALRQSIAGWMADPHPYTCRFGIEMLMVHCLKEAFLPADLAAVAAVGEAREGEYYVAMMCAWYFATALAEQPAAVMPYFAGRRLSPGIWSRAVQKACESLRIPAATKAELRRLRANFC